MSDKPGKTKAEQLFNSALDIETSEARSAFLDQACGNDQDLRAEIDELLRHHADAGSFLERPPHELDPTIPSSGTDANSDESWLQLIDSSDVAGCMGTLGPYEVIELVGRGGMGVVLRGRDPKLNRIVAIKMLAPELSASAVAVQRFLREAQAAAAVSHDHVVTIHAIDERAHPPVIVMEFVDGQSLQQKIDKEGVVDVKSILRIGMQTAAGLAAAHRQGLVHRDIKPSNILLENGIQRVKLTDFGLARAVDDVGVTRTGQITGTPQYMSPEQAQGQRIDHRTDLFSLGCVLYAMCTGRAAFRADSAVAVMHRIVHEAPRPIRELNEDIPQWLCDIVEKLLAKDAAHRFDSARDVEELLGRHLAHLQQPNNVPQPSRIPPVGIGVPSRLDSRTERGLTIVRNVLAVVGILSLGWFVVCLFSPYHGYSNFAFTMPTLLFSLLTGGLGLHGAWQTTNRKSYGWAVTGNVALLFPINLPQILGLVFTIWAAAILWRQEIREAFESHTKPDKYDARPTKPTIKRTFRMSELVILFAACVILLSSSARWHPSPNIGQFDGEQVSIGAVKLPDWRFGVTASQPPLSAWHSALAFREKAKSDWFLEIPNSFLVVAAAVLIGLPVSRRFAFLSDWATAGLILLTAFYGVLHSGMVNCAILQELQQLRVPPLLIFGGFCLAIAAVLSQVAAAGIRSLEALSIDMQLRVAGFGLLLIGIAGALFAMGHIVFFLLTLADILPRKGLPSDPAEVTAIFALCIVVLAAGVVVIHGGRAILQRTSIPWAVIAALIGQPFGIWVLWVLLKRDVPELFRRHPAKCQSSTGDAAASTSRMDV